MRSSPRLRRARKYISGRCRARAGLGVRRLGAAPRNAEAPRGVGFCSAAGGSMAGRVADSACSTCSAYLSRRVRPWLGRTRRRRALGKRRRAELTACGGKQDGRRNVELAPPADAPLSSARGDAGVGRRVPAPPPRRRRRGLPSRTAGLASSPPHRRRATTSTRSGVDAGSRRSSAATTPPGSGQSRGSEMACRARGGGLFLRNRLREGANGAPSAGRLFWLS